MENIRLFENNIDEHKKDESYFGIDLGTTYSVVAVIYSQDISEKEILPVKLVSIEQFSPFELDGSAKSEMVASIIGVDVNNRMYVGNKLYKLKGHPMFIKDKNLFYHWKLDLGVSVKPLYRQSVREDLDDASKVAGKILNYLRLQASKTEKWKNVVVTVPASFQSNQRTDVQQSIRYASIDERFCGILDEPNAAMLGFINQLNNDEKHALLNGGAKNVLVIDFGGGTCDLSLVRMGLDDHVLKMSNLSISRYNDLGGQDIDLLIAEKILLPQFQEQFAYLSIDDTDLEEQLMPQIAVLAERLKIDLSQLISAKYSSIEKIDFSKLNTLRVSEPSYEINLEGSIAFRDANMTALDMYEVIKYLFSVDFQKLKVVDKVIQSLPSVIDDTLKKANLKRNQIDYVLYAGGSVQNLLFVYECQQLLKQTTCLLPQRPDTLIAKGACVYSYYKHRYGVDLIQPIVSDSIGIITQNSDFYPLITAGMALPATFEIDHFNLQGLSQKKVDIPICIDRSASIIQVVSFTLPGFYDQDEKVVIRGGIDENKMFYARVWIDKQPLADVTISNPIALANVSKENRQLIITQNELEMARLNNDTQKERKLLYQLIREYYGVSNFNRSIASANDYLNQFDSENCSVLNYLYCSYEALGQQRKATEIIETARKYHPSNSTIQYNFSLQVERNEGRLEAYEYLMALSQDLIENASIRMRIAILQHQLGNDSYAHSVVMDYKRGKINNLSDFEWRLLKYIYDLIDEIWEESSFDEEAEKEEVRSYNSEYLLRVKSDFPDKVN